MKKEVPGICSGMPHRPHVVQDMLVSGIPKQIPGTFTMRVHRDSHKCCHQEHSSFSSSSNRQPLREFDDVCQTQAIRHGILNCCANIIEFTQSLFSVSQCLQRSGW